MKKFIIKRSRNKQFYALIMSKGRETWRTSETYHNKADVLKLKKDFPKAKLIDETL